MGSEDKVRSEFQSSSDRLLQSTTADESEPNIAEFERLSGQGDLRGWRFDREEIHNRK